MHLPPRIKSQRAKKRKISSGIGQDCFSSIRLDNQIHAQLTSPADGWCIRYESRNETLIPCEVGEYQRTDTPHDTRTKHNACKNVVPAQIQISNLRRFVYLTLLDQITIQGTFLASVYGRLHVIASPRIKFQNLRGSGNFSCM